MQLSTGCFRGRVVPDAAAAMYVVPGQLQSIAPTEASASDCCWHAPCKHDTLMPPARLIFVDHCHLQSAAPQCHQHPNTQRRPSISLRYSSLPYRR